MKNPKVDWFFEKDTSWKQEYALLRDLILECGLNEELKWGVPCYTVNGKNVVLIHGFKEYCALLFHKGVLLKDTEEFLIQQTENVQSARQMRFTDPDQISDMAPIIKAYVFEAVEIEKAGLKVEMKKTKEFDTPDELLEVFEKDPDFKEAFDALTPGRQRSYLLYFSQAKQSKTRLSRIKKSKDNIYAGKGWNEM